MTLTIRHATLSNVQDEGVPGEIGPSEWNESHTITDSDPIVILATGQSNFVQTPAFAWSPEPRAKKWNYNHTNGHVGTAFALLPSATINVADKFASEIARLNPTRQVYLIEISMVGIPIACWLPTPPPPDMWQNILNNITPALAAIGASKIDLLMWWQGEAQVTDIYGYQANWETVHGRFLTQTWFPRTTPVIVFGLAPTSLTGAMAADAMNGQLQAVVRADADCRRYIHSGSLGGSFWLDAFHPNGSGYDQLGKMAAAEFVYGPTRNAAVDPVLGILRPEVLGRPAFRNLIIGGDFTTNPWQRGASFTGLGSNAYSADRWIYATSLGGVVDAAKTADAPTAAQAGVYSQHCLDLAVTTADSSIASGDIYGISQRIEGLNSGFLGFGQSGARPITVSFWVKSTKTGTFYVAVHNNANNRSYLIPYIINATNTWERKSLTIPGDTMGTWLNTTGIGLLVFWTLGAGSSFFGTASAWNAANVFAASDQANALDTIGNHFKLALVQVEEGVGGSPFEALPQDIVLDRCRRYYRKSFELGTAPAQNSGTATGAAFAVSHVASAVFGTRVEFDNNMRALPTVTTYNPVATNADWRDTTNNADRSASVSGRSENGFVVTGASGAAAASNFIQWQADSEL
jgi:hypothetical protein